MTGFSVKILIVLSEKKNMNIYNVIIVLGYPYSNNEY